MRIFRNILLTIVVLVLVVGVLPFLCLSFSFGLHRTGGSDNGGGEGIALKLVSWNVDNFMVSRDSMLRMADYVVGLSPDVICLQERPHTNLVPWESVQEAFDGYEYSVANSREDEVLNLAVLSRWPLSGMKEFYVEDSFNKAMQVDVLMPSDTVRLFNVHLQTTGLNAGGTRSELFKALRANARKRRAQADEIAAAAKASPYPVIICGDFNDTPLSYSYLRLSKGLKDSFLRVGLGWGASYIGLGNLFRIDYILCAPEISLESYQLAETPWSDHKIQVLN